MRKFLVKVNGGDYEVQVEEILGAGQVNGIKPSGPVVATELKPAAPAPAPAAPAPEPVAPAAPAAAPAANGKTVDSPMPGTILSVDVQPGQAVKKGQILAILEAMKMENEILAPEDCTVAAVHTEKGAAVDTGSVLFTLS